MFRRAIGTHAGLLLAVTGAVAWVSGEPFVFPSLGPSAYLLASEPRGPAAHPRRVVGGHAVGALTGLFAYALLGTGTAVTGDVAPLSLAGLALAGSAALSVAMTSWVMLLTDTGHPPACATTLIVSLGLLSRPRDAALIVLAVVVLFGAHRLLADVRYPE